MTNQNSDDQSGENTDRMVSEARALEILGGKRFLSAERVISTWNEVIKHQRTGHSKQPISLQDSAPIWYTEETLKKVEKEHDWYLIFDPGFSLRDNRAILGTDPEHQPCHRQDNDWWLSSKEDFWVNKTLEPAYHLLMMEGIFPLDNPSKDWDWQEEQIHQMGEVFQRTPTQILANACVSCFLLNNERHLENNHNFGPEIDTDYCFLVTNFGHLGLNIGHWLRNDWGGYWQGSLCVHTMRRNDLL